MFILCSTTRRLICTSRAHVLHLATDTAQQLGFYLFVLHCSAFADQEVKGLNYGFVEYDDPAAAERAMSTLNGRRVHQSVSSQARPLWPRTAHASCLSGIATVNRIFADDHTGDKGKLGVSVE